MTANFKRLFRKPTPKEVAARELADAELARLAAHTAREYAEARCACAEARINRLRLFLGE